MVYQAAAHSAARGPDVGGYSRHRPEQTLLYQIVEEHYPTRPAYRMTQIT